jgi:hypothetical protein
MFIPDPDLDFLPIPDPGVRKAPDHGSGFAALAIIHADPAGSGTVNHTDK